MKKPTLGQWGQVREMVARGSLGWHPTQSESRTLQAVLDYVRDLETEYQALLGECGRLRTVNADLMAACEAMIRHIDQVGDDEDLTVCRDRMCAAIARARGEVSND